MSNLPRRRFPARYNLLAVLLVFAVAAIVIPIAMPLIETLRYGEIDAYSEQYAARLVIQYMEENGGRWPSSWQELKPYYNMATLGIAFEEFSRSIHIDFNVNPEKLSRELKNGAKDNYDVIYAIRRTGVHFREGPDSILRNYFRRQP